jgi:hypothetical protein
MVFSTSVAAAPALLTIQGDAKIGGYSVKADGTLNGAIASFGRGSSTRPLMYRGRLVREACVARWRTIGLRITFYDLGGRDPCEPQFGYFREAVMTGLRWRTASGLRVGHPSRYILRYHPEAKRSPSASQWWWLVTRHSRIGIGGNYGALEAKVVNGFVSAFRVNYAAGGD